MSKKHQYKISAKKTRRKASRCWRRQYKSSLSNRFSKLLNKK